MNVLLVFASTHGHTVRIAQRVARVLRREGHHVSVRRIDEAPDRLDRWDAVVVGGSLHYAHHQPELEKWVHAHHRALKERPNAFFSVSLSAADPSPHAQQAVRDCIDRFVEDTEWDPDVSFPVAGCLQYCEYDPATRLALRLMMHREGRPDDISQDFEMTDWPAVERFAADFASRIGHALPIAV